MKWKSSAGLYRANTVAANATATTEKADGEISSAFGDSTEEGDFRRRFEVEDFVFIRAAAKNCLTTGGETVLAVRRNNLSVART
jgi:hypothetical protein